MQDQATAQGRKMASECRIWYNWGATIAMPGGSGTPPGLAPRTCNGGSAMHDECSRDLPYGQTPLPNTAALARADGSKHYLTGKPCRRGHVAPRFTSNQQCTECTKRHSRDYHERHKDEANARSRAYAKRDVEGNRRRSADFWASLTPEERQKRSSRNSHAYYHGNPARWKAVRGAWKACNRARLRQYLKARRARIYGAAGKVSLEAWEAIKAHFGYTCPACNRSEPTITLTQDHVVPLSRGGAHRPSNIQPLCKPCNSRKSTYSTDYRGGWRYGE